MCKTALFQRNKTNHFLVSMVLSAYHLDHNALLMSEHFLEDAWVRVLANILSRAEPGFAISICQASMFTFLQQYNFPPTTTDRSKQN